MHAGTHLARIFLFLLALTAPLSAQIQPSWTTNHVPFRIVGNLYYVGSDDLAAYLITTPQGNILLNTNLASSVSQIKQNIETLGFHFEDTKILLNSQAHFDHTAGTAEIKRLTGARLAIMDPDIMSVETGGREDFFYYNDPSAQFKPVHVDQVLHDGDHVTLGDTALTAHLTPGHTKGTTTWTMTITDAGHTYNVLILGGAGVNTGNNLIHDPRYPTQAADFVHTFQVLRSLPCDVFLGAHGLYFNLAAKYPKLKPGQPNPFIDPEGCKGYIDEREQAFQKELARQTAQHQ